MYIELDSVYKTNAVCLAFIIIEAISATKSRVKWLEAFTKLTTNQGKEVNNLILSRLLVGVAVGKFQDNCPYSAISTSIDPIILVFIFYYYIAFYLQFVGNGYD